MSVDIDEFRRSLWNIRTRAAAMDAAVDGGDEEDYTDAAIQLLNDRDEGVRWSAVRILAEIGDERAVVPLIALMERGKNITGAVNALRAITEQEFGADPRAWREWAALQPEQRGRGGLGILSDKDLLLAAVKGLPAEVSGGKGQYAVTVSLDDGRSQQIWVDFSKTDTSDQPIVQISTPCGEAVADQYEAALKLNMAIPYGAVALALLDGKLCFAMVDAYLRSTVHPEDIAQSIMMLAREGDGIEKALAEEDRY